MGGYIPVRNGAKGCTPPAPWTQRQTLPWADTHCPIARWDTHPPGHPPPPVEITIKAGGTHLTGMHSCFYVTKAMPLKFAHSFLCYAVGMTDFYRAGWTVTQETKTQI